MSNSTVWMQVASQLLTQLPVLLVYIGGIVLCAMWWGRAPRAAMFATVGIGLLLAATVGSMFISAVLLQQRVIAGGGSVQSYAWMMMFVAIGGAIIRAGGMALLLAAVFTGREPREISGF